MRLEELIAKFSEAAGIENVPWAEASCAFEPANPGLTDLTKAGTIRAERATAK